MSASPSSDKKRKILLLGWDAADWKVINPMLDAGKMPVLQSLIEEGVMVLARSVQPVTGAAHRKQVFGVFRIGFDFSPDFGDMNVDGSCLYIEVLGITPYF